MHATQLLELFTQDIGHAEQLLKLIEAEHLALAQRDLAQLQDLLSAKSPCSLYLSSTANSAAKC